MSFSDHATRRRTWLWGGLAGVNMAYGLWLVRDPLRTDDFLTVRSWASAWWTAGANLYSPQWNVDYPPNALVTLTPLAFLTESASVWVWAVLNLALAVVAPFLAIRVMAPRTARPAVTELTLLFLCWSGTKVVTQYSLVAFACGLLAMSLANRRSLWSGVALGLALMKPQIAAPFALWALLGARWRIVASAAATVAAGWLVYAIRAGISPIAVLVSYADILQLFNTGATAQVGASNLRPLVGEFVSGESGDLIAAVTALLMLAIVVGLVIRTPPSDRVTAPALGGAWSLATFYHLTYGFILLLPAAIMLRLDDNLRTRKSRTAMFWVLQAGLIVDGPGVGRRISPYVAAEVARALEHADRVFVVLVFGAVAWLATTRMRMTASGDQRA